MPRFAFGPSQEFAESTDVSVALKGIERGGKVTLTVGEPDPEFSEPLTGLHVVYLATQPSATDTAEAVLAASTLKASADPATLAAGGDVVVTVPGVPPGKHFVQSILEFAK